MLAVSGLMPAQTPAPSTPSSAPAPPAVGAGSPAPVASSITAPPDPNKVVLTIGPDKMTVAQFEMMLKAFPPQLQAAANGPQRHQFVEQYVQLRLAAQEAERRGLDKKAEVQEQMAIQHDNLLAQSLYQELIATVKVTDAEVEKYYNEHKNEFETCKAHHILIRFKGSQVPAGKDKKELSDEEALAKAKEIQKKLEGGADFATVAKAESDDTGSGANGGDLGSFSHGSMVKPFDDAAFSLPIGKISDPVKTPFGYHIIRVDSRETKTLAEVKPEIEKKLGPDIARKEVEGLKDKTIVIIDDQFFASKPVGPPPPHATK